MSDEVEKLGELIAKNGAEIARIEIELRKLRAKRARLKSAVKAIEKVEAT